MKINKPKSSKTKITLLTLSVIVALGLGYFTYAYMSSSWPFNNPESALESSTLEDDNGNKIDDQPATDDNQQMVNEKKERDRERIEQNEKNEQNREGKKNVDVVITTFSQDADGVHVNGYVSGVVENDGTCKVTLTNEDGKTISTTRKSHINAQNTTCGQSTIPPKDLQPGKWTISLSYDSKNSIGKSQANIAPTIEVK